MLSEHFIPGAAGNFSRKAWLLGPGEASPGRMIVFLDAEFYLDGMKAESILARLIDEGGMPSLPVLFLSHLDPATRHRELTCDENFTDFVGVDVLAWMRDRYPSLAAGDHLIAGPSLGGLAATFITLRYPQVYSRCLSQSGSYWWNEEWLTRHLGEIPASPAKFRISVGDRETVAGVTHAPSGLRQEVAQRDACERFTAVLAGAGQDVDFHLFEGGHDFRCWAAELPGALSALLK
jgi:enterochelin esterase-like enzyme